MKKITIPIGLNTKTETPTNDEIHLEIVQIWEALIILLENQEEVMEKIDKQ